MVWLKISHMKNVLSLMIGVMLCAVNTYSLAEPYVYPSVHVHDLPSPLRLAGCFFKGADELLRVDVA